MDSPLASGLSGSAAPTRSQRVSQRNRSGATERGSAMTDLGEWGVLELGLLAVSIFFALIGFSSAIKYVARMMPKVGRKARESNKTHDKETRG
jgi:hypothetical protein